MSGEAFLKGCWRLCAATVLALLVFVAVAHATSGVVLCNDGGALPPGQKEGQIGRYWFYRCSLNEQWNGMCENKVEGKYCDNANLKCECHETFGPGGQADCMCFRPS